MEARNSRKKISTFILISLIGHVLAFLFLNKYWNSTPPAAQTVYVDLDPALVQEALKAKQIVQTENAGEAKADPAAKYLSERDQTVAKETKARVTDRFRSAETNGAQASGRTGTKGLSLKDLASKEVFEAREPKENAGEKVAEKKKQNTAGDGGAAGSASSDYLRDLADGERTMLSTREFKYFGYHQRIRDRLEVAWNSRLRKVWTNYVMGARHPAGQRDYITKLFVVMDRHGEIVAVKVLEASGARDLDRAAVEAFNQIGPFPDPPSGIVEADGTIKIPWSFVVSL